MKRTALLLALVLLGCTNALEQSEAAEVGTATTLNATTADLVGAGSIESVTPEPLSVTLNRDDSPGTSVDSTAPTSAAPTSSTTTTLTTAAPATSTTTAAPTTTTTAASAPSTSGDGSNPIAVPVQFLADAKSSGAARCIEVDLHTIAVPSNPGYVGETLGDQQLSGDQLWAISYYLMLYANCERQARGLEPFAMYSVDKQLAMQQTVLGINTAHGRFGERADIAGGGAAEGHGGGPLIGEPFTSGVLIEDDDGNGVWSESEIARRSASGNQQNGGAGLVDHGNAMTSTSKSCIFAAASLGASEDHRVDIIIFYGTSC